MQFKQLGSNCLAFTISGSSLCPALCSPSLFFLAFLPQFVVVDAPDKGLALLLLGLIFVFNATLMCLCVAAFAARTARGVRQSGRAELWINRGLGGLFVYLGTRIALLQAR